jgi:FkbM family methyltransferase
MPFSLAEMLGRSCPQIDIVDVGAMAVEATAEYSSILSSAPCRVVGFEPVQAECDKLNAFKQKNHVYLPYFIGDGEERTFHLTNYSMTSSLYEPNAPLLSKFNQLAEITTTVETSRVKTQRMDDIPELTNIDLLKIDIQGAEHDAFRGAPRLLSETLVVWTEVEFVRMYKDQPLFADVDIELRKRNLMFHTFHTLAGRAYKPLMPASGFQGALRQQMWSDAIYLRDVMTIHDLSEAKMLKLAVLAHDLVQSYDYAQLVLQHYDRKFGKKLWKLYMKRLTGADPGEPTLRLN